MAARNDAAAGADTAGRSRAGGPSAQRQLVDLQLQRRHRPPLPELIAQAREERVTWRDMPEYLERASSVRVSAMAIRSWVPELVGAHDLRKGRAARRRRAQ